MKVWADHEWRHEYTNEFVRRSLVVYVQDLLGVGVNGYHLKDQPLSDLRLAVQRVLAGERWVCSPLVEKLVRAHEPATPGLVIADLLA